MSGNYSFDSSSPIYLQIAESIQLNIVSDKWKPGQRVLPVRDLAIEFGVNPNTMQRALFELERIGLMYSERTSGRFVTDDIARIATLRDSMSEKETAWFLSYMEKLGFTADRIAEKVDSAIKRGKR